MFHLFFLLLVLNLPHPSHSEENEKVEVGRNSSNTRTKKLFNLFSIVTFPNNACQSGTSGSNGTCLSASECTSRGGTISGSCASGFGACCIVEFSSCGGTISYNCTYLVNPGYPSSYTSAGTCTWSIPKTQSDVCFIRLDFDVFTIAAPDAATSVGQCTTDYFQGTNAKTGTNSASGKTTPKICGVNTGSHMYIDAGTQTSEEASLTADLTGTTTNRSWKIKVTQILCSATNKPSTGCLQYHTGTTGQVRSYNFLADSYLHLGSQFYKVCVRRERGYCKIAWTQSSDPDSFKISRPATVYTSNNGQTGCAQDSVKIYGGSDYGLSNVCTAPGAPGISLSSVDRYCGGTLTCTAGSSNPATIISSRVPFDLDVDFSSVDTAGANNRGFCLNYYQILC